MVATGNQRTKRKQESVDVKTEPAMKAMKKNDLIIQFKDLQQKYEKMEKQNMILLQEKENHTESILLLEETVKILENKAFSVEKTSVSVQTEIIRCEECEFPAESINDLVFHMYEFHPLEVNENMVKCNYCSDTFTTKGDLMAHRKEVHTENVEPCIHFNEGKCDFGDKCWFSHNSLSKESGHEYKCNICHEKFKIKSAFMRHRKAKHSESVPGCKNEFNGSCHHGSKNCWFRHNEDKNNKYECAEKSINEEMNDEENISSQKMIQKLVDMVEKYAERILILEKMMTKDK